MGGQVRNGTDEEVIARARAELRAFEPLYPLAKVIEKLLRRYPHAVVQSLLPNATLPEVVSAETESKRTSQPPKTPETGKPMGVGELLEKVQLGAPPCSASASAQPKDERPAPPRASNDADELGFMYVPLIQCTLPHSNPDPEHMYTRLNGDLQVTLATSLPTVGLPYGVPGRLLAIYITREVTLKKTKDIYLQKTMTDFLRTLNVPVSSGRRGTMGTYFDHLQRLLNTVISVVETNAVDGGRLKIDIKKKLFAEKISLWQDKGTSEVASFTLAEPLFQSMLERSAPLSMEAVFNLRRSPFDLDLYAWLVYRLYTLKRPLFLRWDELALQFGQGYARERDFIFYFGKSLQRVLKEYPEAKVEVTEDGLKLLPSRQHIASLKAA